MKLKGIVSAFVTPMLEDETINERELRRQVDRQINAGAAAVFCCGTNGECYALSHDEKLRVTALTAEAAAGRVPVLSGTGCITTAETIQLSREAQRCGASAVSLVLPYFASMVQEEIFRHYWTVADAVELPVIIYNIPARTGNAIAPETVHRLSAHPNIIGIKDSSGNFDMLKQCIAMAGGPDFQVLSGTDSLILPTLIAGGDGAISAVTNVLPELVYSIYTLFSAGDIYGAQKAQAAIQPLRDCFKFGNPNTVVKRATELMGFPVGRPRRPFCYLSEEAERAISETLSDHYQEYLFKQGGDE